MMRRLSFVLAAAAFLVLWLRPHPLGYVVAAEPGSGSSGGDCR